MLLDVCLFVVGLATFCVGAFLVGEASPRWRTKPVRIRGWDVREMLFGLGIALSGALNIAWAFR